MSCNKEDRATLTPYQYKTPEEKYQRCRLLNTVQHIDIYGKHKAVYNEQRSRIYRYDPTASSLSISTTSTRYAVNNAVSATSLKMIEAKLSRLSITTRVSGLYPGNDILSKRVRRSKVTGGRPVFCNYVPR